MGKKAKYKVTKDTILNNMNYDFSRDAEWFKRTNNKIQEIKDELSKNFYDDNKKQQKLDFLHKLKNKVKDYVDAIKYESRYKKIKFIERRKIERKLAKINKQLEINKNDEGLIKEKLNIENDLNYVKYYPKTYKYV